MTPKQQQSDLAAELLAPAAVAKGPGCSVAAMLKRLASEDPAAAAALEQAMAMHTTDMPSSVIAARLRERDYIIGRESIQRHRRRASGTGCACPT